MNDHDLLVRIDERMINLEKSITELENKLRKNFVTKIEFKPIKKIIYGFLGVVLTSVLFSILSLIFYK